ncbi:MAG: hypothetical protein GX952_06490 [Firmicutes bacterium]|nr:hypothetical protein [Bacillota bacterium]
MHTLDHLKCTLQQKEQALIQYVKYMREAQDSQKPTLAAVFADLAKAEEKHITVIRDQLDDLATDKRALNVYQDVSQYQAQRPNL